MSRANRRKRLYRDVAKRLVTDAQGRDGVVYQPPDDWLDLEAAVPDEVADAFVRDLRASGVKLWLHADRATGTVRTRMQFPGGYGRPDLQTLTVLSKYARVLGKAVERSGDWQPEPGNAFGDRPLPPGGHWRWE